MTTSSIPGPGGERRRSMQRFGSHCELRAVPPDGHRGHAEQRLDRAERILEEFDLRLSRFRPDSELCALNSDPREAVPASPMMERFAEAVSWAGRRSDGLVDATMLDAVEVAGYTDHLPRRRIGRRWIVIHRFAGLAWVLAVAHTLGAGSDAGQTWYLAVVALCVVPVIAFAGYRIAKARRTRRPTPLRGARPRLLDGL